MADRGLSAGIGANLRRIREEHDWSQDLVSSTARLLGLKWQRSTVSSIETGRRQLTLEETVLLPTILSALSGDDVSLTFDLLPREVVELTETVEAEPEWLLETIRGAAPRLAGRGDVGLDYQSDPDRPDYGAVIGLFVAGLHVDTPADPTRGREAEQKAARRLDVPLDLVVTTAHRLWGHGLTEEREQRLQVELGGEAGDQEARTTVSALRGHITRQLVAELEDAIPPASP